MAKITIEDCLQKVPNRFELALLAANRTKSLINGAESLIENTKNERNVVLSLREIANDKLNLDELRSSIGKNLVYGHAFGYEDDTFVTEEEEEGDNFGTAPDSFNEITEPKKSSPKKENFDADPLDDLDEDDNDDLEDDMEEDYDVDVDVDEDEENSEDDESDEEE